jgi:hypothetical protein
VKVGEAKRRNQSGSNGPADPQTQSGWKGARFLDPAAPEIRELLAAGQPINVHLFGAAALLSACVSLPFRQFMNSERHAMRLAFMSFDRIRTGEFASWTCLLCGHDFSGLNQLSVVAVIERALGEPKPDKPGIVASVCHACDSVSPEETSRRIHASFGLLETQSGRA